MAYDTTHQPKSLTLKSPFIWRESKTESPCIRGHQALEIFILNSETLLPTSAALFSHLVKNMPRTPERSISFLNVPLLSNHYYQTPVEASNIRVQKQQKK